MKGESSTYNSVEISTSYGDGIFTPRSKQTTDVLFQLRDDAPDDLRIQYSFDAADVPLDLFTENTSAVDAISVIMQAGTWLFALADLHKLKTYLETNYHSDEVGRLATVVKSLKYQLDIAKQELEYAKEMVIAAIEAAE